MNHMVEFEAPWKALLVRLRNKVRSASMSLYWAGRVIVISSINGQKGQMGQVNYSAAKAGDLGFVKALAQESANKGLRSMPSARAISAPKWYRPSRPRS